MESPEIRSIDLLLPFIQQAPPWLVLSVLAGVVSASAFFIVAGRGFRSLPTYLVLGAAVAPLVQVAGASLPSLPPPLMIGETHLATVGVGTWVFLAIARLLRL